MIQTYQNKEIVHTWPLNDFSVRLFKDGDKLFYENVKTHQDKVEVLVVSSISYNGSMEKVIEIMKNRNPFLKEDMRVSFYPLFNKWSLVNKEISLIKTEKEFSWNISYKGSSLNVSHSFSKMTIPSLRCHENTKNFIEKIKKEIDKDSIDIIAKDFIVTRILDEEEYKKELKERKTPIKQISVFKSPSDIAKGLLGAAGLPLIGESALNLIGITLIPGYSSWIISSFTGIALTYTYYAIAGKMGIVDNSKKIYPLSPEKPLYVEIEPYSVPSTVDERVRISKLNWSVMIFDGVEGTCGRYHTSILIEGIRQEESSALGGRKSFICHAHFRPPVEINYVGTRELQKWLRNGFRRSDIWMVSSDLVRKMMSNIIQERNSQAKMKSEGIRAPFNILGIDSVLADDDTIGKGHNCNSWALEKLQMLGIDKENDLLSKIISFSATQNLSQCRLTPFYPQI